MSVVILDVRSIMRLAALVECMLALRLPNDEIVKIIILIYQ